MPKIIKNLEQKIFEVSEDLFKENGYDNVDMRLIAKKVGIAVGTLYNYYPNKRDLFTRVFEKSWKNTFEKLDLIISSDNPPKKKILLFLEEMYEEIINRKGMGRELLKADFFECKLDGEVKIDRTQSDRLRMITKILKEKMRILVIEEKGVDKESLDEGTDERIASLLILMSWSLLIDFPDEKEKNIRFIRSFLDAYI